VKAAFLALALTGGDRESAAVAPHWVAGDEAVATGIEEKSHAFAEKGNEIYVKA
jgi:hypothetical protein